MIGVWLIMIKGFDPKTIDCQDGAWYDHSFFSLSEFEQFKLKWEELYRREDIVVFKPCLIDLDKNGSTE